MTEWLEHEAKAECLDLRQRVRELEAQLADANEKLAEREAELLEARRLLRCVIPNCEWLHHTKKDRHRIGYCPVEERIAQYDFDPDGIIEDEEARDGESGDD